MDWNLARPIAKMLSHDFNDSFGGIGIWFSWSTYMYGVCLYDDLQEYCGVFQILRTTHSITRAMIKTWPEPSNLSSFVCFNLNPPARES